MTALREKMAEMAETAGMSLDALFGKARKSKGSVSPKYRDPKEPGEYLDRSGSNAALDGGGHQASKAKKEEDFLI